MNLRAPIDGSGYEYGPSVSPEARTLYYNSERGGSVGIYRIPVAALSG